MKLHILLGLVWLMQLSIATAEYRYTRRGGVIMMPRPMSMAHYKKKIQPQTIRPQRSPIRQRPIAMHFPQKIMAPIAPLPVGPRPEYIPQRTFWNNKNNFKIETEKPFVYSTPINNVEYDYHIQTNNVPVHSIPIKQVGEKGPIHTIPAPKLSPADKPLMVEEVRPISQQNSFIKVQKAHQYQVTESSDHQIKNFNQQQLSLPIEVFANLNAGHVDSVQTPKVQELPNNLYKVVNSFPVQSELLRNPQHSQVINGFAIQQGLQPNQPVPNYQAFQPESAYISQIHQSINQNQPLNFEQQNAKTRFEYLTNLAPELKYDLDVPEPANTANSGQIDQTIYSQKDYTQFSNIQEPENENGDLDNKKVMVEIVDPPQFDENDAKNIISTDYFSTLPNRQAAEALASLQEAGKMNSNIMQQSQNVNINQNIPLEIYVPEAQSEKANTQTEYSTRQESSQQGYSQGSVLDDSTDVDDELLDVSKEQQDAVFGARIKPKRS